MSGELVKAFADTNVLVNFTTGEYRKADKAKQILAAGGFVSVQVRNENGHSE